MDMEATVEAQKYYLRTKLGGAIIYTFSPEANMGGIPQWVIKAPDGTVVYRINLFSAGPTVANVYTIKTRDGGEVFYLEEMASPTGKKYALKAKLGGSIIAIFGIEPNSDGKKWGIRASDGSLIYLISSLPVENGLLAYAITNKDNKSIYILTQF